MDETGRAILTNFHRRIAIHHFSFKSRVSALKFSPSGRHFAVGVGRRLQIWQTPSTPGTETNGEIEFAPFVLHRDSAAHFDTVQSIEWSSDSRFLLSASRDLTARVWSLDAEEGFEPTTLAGHRQGVVSAYFNAEQEKVSRAYFRMDVFTFSNYIHRSIRSAKTVPYSVGNILRRLIPKQKRKLAMLNGGSRRKTSSCKMTRKSIVPHFTHHQICS